MTRVSGGTLGLAAALLVAGGALAGMLVAAGPVPASVAGSDGPTSAPVTLESHDDARTVKVEPVLSASSRLDLAASGTVTRTSCTPGGEIVSGTSPVTVDGRPVVALATAVPLWRELSWGDEGDDVEALQAELVRLGHDLDADGEFGRATYDAVNALLADVGVGRPDGRIAPADVLWIPARRVAVTSCETPLGGSAGAFATTSGVLTGLRLTGGTAEDGRERVARVAGVEAPVGADGTVTDPDLLAALADSPEMDTWRRTDGESGLTVELALADPLEVAVVPPGALFGLVGDHGCVRSDGATHPVTVVASSLGQTSVTFDDADVPDRVDLVGQRPGRSC
ncbi:putative peptidoglycan binding protein [Isoptericola jiangsuensis]|uniref:Putative peptidoglycan binding protein n=1 Tax=Isoptericola jiangsuensis TaxID=548579 RepID=A0A2A9EUD7_9MICO|nr:peptidoglycan-binding domain-containing protein [Isoptericola jiangsuensis]PFG41779.1 putative peptidoglycan binding protein [Isoptericola jiangsuensis]